MYPPFSIAIRTLGTAGNKFEREIQSIMNLAIQPEAVFAYIPHGYPIPNFEGSEIIQWIRCNKGMITQRSLPFREINTPFILFMDDDVELRPDSVNRLFDGIKAGYDSIVANTFCNHLGTWKGKLFNWIYCGTHFSFRKKWAFRIRRSGHYTYCNNPYPIMATQSGAGPCLLISRHAYDAIRFQDERWLDTFGYPFGEDQLFFQKLHLNGFKTAACFDSGIIHLDGGTSSRTVDHETRLKNNTICKYLVWRRTLYNTQTSALNKFYTGLCYYGALLQDIVVDTLNVCRGNKSNVKLLIAAIREAQQFASSEDFINLPPFKQ